MSRRKRAKSKKAFRLKLKKGTVFSIAQVTFFSLAALVLISFSRQGLALVRLNDFLVDYFSWTTIFLPFIFLSFALLISKLRGPLSQPNVVVGILLFLLSIIGIIYSVYKLLFLSLLSTKLMINILPESTPMRFTRELYPVINKIKSS